MINASRKDLTEAVKWSRKNSPVAYFVLSMNGKWGTPSDNALNIVAALARLWPGTRASLSTAAAMNYPDGGRLRPETMTINYPSERIRERIRSDFFELLFKAAKYMDEAEDYAFMESFARDMLALFVWDDNARGIWTGTLLYALDKEGRYDEAYGAYRALDNPGEQTAALYALSVLERCDTERAAAVLEPFRDSADETIRERIRLLDRLKAVKG